MCQAVVSQCVNVGRRLILIRRIILRCGVVHSASLLAEAHSGRQGHTRQALQKNRCNTHWPDAEAQTSKLRKQMQKKSCCKFQEHTKTENNCETSALWGPVVRLERHKRDACKRFCKLSQRWNEKLLFCCICFMSFSSFWDSHHISVCSRAEHCSPQWQCASLLLPLRHSWATACSSSWVVRSLARHCRKSFCGCISQAVINAHYFHTLETQATCLPCYRGSHTYSWWAEHPVEKVVSQLAQVEVDTYAVWLWPFFFLGEIYWCDYLKLHRDKIKDAVRLSKHANVLL